MFATRAFFLCFVLYFFPFLTAEESGVFLHYPSGMKVFQTFETQVEMESELPVMTWNEWIKQKIFAELTFFSEGREGEQPSQGVEVVLKRVIVELRANNREKRMDTDDANSSFEFVQLEKVMGRPFFFRLDSDNLLGNSDSLTELEKAFPSIGSVMGMETFSEMFFYLFILKNKELFAGKKVKGGKETDIDINRVDSQEVQVSFGRRLERKELEFSGGNRAVLGGVLSGTGSWKSENALFYKSKIHQSISGDLYRGEAVVPIRMKIIQWINAIPLNLSH